MWAIGNGLIDPIKSPKTIYLYGTGGVGKSVLIESIEQCLGRAAHSMSKDYMLTTSDLSDEDLIACCQSRFVTCGETSLLKKRINEKVFKAFSGNDKRATRWGEVRANCTDDDIYEFLMKCIHTRMVYEHPPVTLEMACTSIFGNDAKKFTRGLRFNPDADFLQTYSASKSISIMSKIEYGNLIDMFKAFSSLLIVESCGLRAICGFSITSLYLIPARRRDFEEGMYRNYSKWMERSTIVAASTLYQEARSIVNGMTNTTKKDDDDDLQSITNDIENKVTDDLQSIASDTE
ncbi:hypothetical protein BC830DRAFT_1207675 [Chytriomyces sp. MP71]|nr:hypothetical protein BC830DRAFT_1207675 [Chytriomyces sp. MP71]